MLVALVTKKLRVDPGCDGAVSVPPHAAAVTENANTAIVLIARGY
jgi:uncharacterized membrane protein